jgi:hypothetical protein
MRSESGLGPRHLRCVPKLIQFDTANFGQPLGCELNRDDLEHRLQQRRDGRQFGSDDAYPAAQFLEVPRKCGIDIARLLVGREDNAAEPRIH